MANEFVVRNGLISLGGMTYPYTSKNFAYSIGENDYFINELIENELNNRRTNID
jgi:hypothetical protein